MNSSHVRALRQLAELHGIQTRYTDAAGGRQDAVPETLVSLLAALGQPLNDPSDAREALADAKSKAAQTWVEPVIVIWDGEPGTVQLQIPTANSHRRAAVELHLEDGSTKPLQPRPSSRSRSDAELSEVALPKLPPGYHTLSIECGSHSAEALLLAAPSRSYAGPDEAQRWGIFVPMYAMHTRSSWGAGNFSDWDRFGAWAAAQHCDLVGTLPLLAAFLDSPVCEPSPYAPASRLFWNEFYVDVEALPEFAASPAAQKLVRSTAFQRRLTGFRRSRTIDYAEQARARSEVLAVLAESLATADSPRKRELERFLRQRPELVRYAQFRAACDRLDRSWHAWPERQRNGHLRPADYAESRRHYHSYVQWVAQEQMSKLVHSCRSRGVQFYLDLPLGVHPDGYDVWREREIFALGASVGAPPDLFFSLGQNWGFAPMHPERIRAQKYRYVLEYLRFQMRHTGLLRIDHVMGLHRLYWIPQGLPPNQGAYVAYHADELYALLSLESHRHQTTLVGENLGTVPPRVNAAMDRHRLRQMYVLQFEQRPDPKKALRTPIPRCVASLNTHDLPTFAAHWHGKDIADRVTLGLMTSRQAAEEKRSRRKLNTALVTFLVRGRFLKEQARPPVHAVWSACLRWLSASPAETVLLNLEDSWAEESPQNVPGTHRERPNWRRKCQRRLEDIEGDAELAAFLQSLDRLRAQSREASGTRRRKH